MSLRQAQGPCFAHNSEVNSNFLGFQVTEPVEVTDQLVPSTDPSINSGQAQGPCFAHNSEVNSHVLGFQVTEPVEFTDQLVPSTCPSMHSGQAQGPVLRTQLRSK